MAKRKTGCLSRHRLGIVRAAWLASTMAVALAQANKLPASDLVHSSSSASNTVTAWLACQETDYAVLSGSVGLKSRPTSFKKEPAPASGRIVRGVLNFGADPSNSIAFIWQCGEGKLCLDLNRNEDLTDDPAGVFFPAHGPQPITKRSPTSICSSTPLLAGARSSRTSVSGLLVRGRFAAWPCDPSGRAN